MNSIWIARDMDNSLFAYEQEPFRDSNEWMNKELFLESAQLPEGWFPDLRWEDEPIELVAKEKEIRKSCSNCLYFKDEAIDGTGICHAFNTEHFYNDEGCSDWEKKED